MSCPCIVFWRIAFSFLLLATSEFVWGHTRLECPPPRSGDTGAKLGPCDAPDDLNLPPYPLRPGLNTVTWLESIGHPGAPARFALSMEGVDEGFESCVLLDHVPHDENSRPNFRDSLTYHRSSITLWLPDVYCERCHLQLITFMTDNFHGLVKGNECSYLGAIEAGTVDEGADDCKVVYHSCAPISINGTIPRDEYQCSLEDFVTELDWPFMVDKPPASTYAFKGDPGLYDPSLARLLSSGEPVEGCNNPTYCDPTIYYRMENEVPPDAKYVEPHGTCSGIVDMVVEPFVLGQLPSVLKDDDYFEDESEDVTTANYEETTDMTTVEEEMEDITAEDPESSSLQIFAMEFIVWISLVATCGMLT